MAVRRPALSPRRSAAGPSAPLQPPGMAVGPPHLSSVGSSKTSEGVMTFPAIPQERELAGVAPFRRGDGPVPTPITMPAADDRDAIIGDGDALRYVMFRVDQVAATDATVLLSGETGTGKELLARAIHQRSPRREPSARRRQLRGAAGEPGRERALRPRARRVHGRACDADWPLRARPPRHDPPRRGRRAAARAAAQAAPRAAGGPGRTARQPAHRRRRRPRHRGDQSRPDRGSPSGSFPSRPVLSAQRVSDHHTVAARSA